MYMGLWASQKYLGHMDSLVLVAAIPIHLPHDLCFHTFQCLRFVQNNYNSWIPQTLTYLLPFFSLLPPLPARRHPKGGAVARCHCQGLRRQ